MFHPCDGGVNNESGPLSNIRRGEGVWTPEKRERVNMGVTSEGETLESPEQDGSRSPSVGVAVTRQNQSEVSEDSNSAGSSFWWNGERIEAFREATVSKAEHENNDVSFSPSNVPKPPTVTQDDAHRLMALFQYPTETLDGDETTPDTTVQHGPMMAERPAEELDNASPASSQVAYQRPVETQDDVPLGLVTFDVFQKFAQGYLQLWFHGLMVQQLERQPAKSEEEREPRRQSRDEEVHPILLSPDEFKNTVAVQDEVKKAVAYFKTRVEKMMDVMKSNCNEFVLDNHVGNLPNSAVLVPRATIEGLALPHVERREDKEPRPSGLVYKKRTKLVHCTEQAPKTKKRKSQSNESDVTASSPQNKSSPSHRTQRARKKTVPLSKKNNKQAANTQAANTTNNDTSKDNYHDGKNIDKARSYQHPERP